LHPIPGLYYAAILNGIVSPPMLIIIMLIGNNRKILGGRVNGTASNLAGWIAAFT
jgi:Mn2+/Fe2+ NRAMP family transporter